MFFQGALDLEWPNAVTSAVDDIIGPADEPEIAVLVFIRAVAGNIPITANASSAGIWIAPVFPEHPDRALRLHAHCDVPFFIWWQRHTVVVNHLDLKTGRGFAHRTGFDLNRRKVAAQEHGFGLAIAVADGHAGFGLPHFDHFGVQGLASPNAIAE